MRTFITPTKDTTIFSRLPLVNAGLDEVLYVGKDSGSNRNRSLMQFDMTTVASSISSSTIPVNCDFYLNLKIANATSISDDLTLYIYPLLESWKEGTGLSIQETSNPGDGASWIYHHAGDDWTQAGGVFDATTVSSSFIFTKPLSDIRVNVNTIVRSWLSGTLENCGFAIKLHDNVEVQSTASDAFSIFSKDTHTVYIPTLEMAWNDQSFGTGTLEAAPEAGLHVSLRSLRSVYSRGERSRVNVSCREKYPLKTFDTIFRYNTTKYLPTTTYYKITDIQTNEIIIPFDQYSLVSCDSTGNYFILDTSNLYKGRKYNISIKITNGSYTDIFENINSFEVM